MGKCSGLRSALGACRSVPWRGDAVGWHVLGGNKGKLPRWCPCRGWHWLDRGRTREYLGPCHGGKLALQSGYTAVFLFKPCHNLGCAFAVEGYGNESGSLIGGKVAALAVMIDAIPGRLLGLSRFWLASVVIGSFSVLHTSQKNYLVLYYSSTQRKSLAHQTLNGRSADRQSLTSYEGRTVSSVANT